jgi:replicative DNA helicase
MADQPQLPPHLIQAAQQTANAVGSIQNMQQGNAHTKGEYVIAAMLKEGKLSALMDNNITGDLFDAFERDGFRYISTFAKNYGKMPEVQTFMEHSNFTKLPEVTEPLGFYLDALREQFLSNQIRDALMDAKTAIVDQGSAQKAMELLTSRVMTMGMGVSSRQVFSNADMREVITRAIHEKLASPDAEGIEFGWDTVDRLSGGLVGGDMYAIVGRPQQGKSWMTLWNAMHAWRAQAKRVMYVSMEMIPLICMQRLAAIYTQVGVGGIMSGKLATDTMSQLQNGLMEISNAANPFWIMDGNLTATTEEVYKQAMMLKPDLIIVDGAYLMGHENKRLDRFARVAENMRSLKSDIATDLKVPVGISMQFNREAAKKAKKSKGDDRADLEDIGMTDEIPQLCSVVMALQQKVDAASIKRKEVDLIKARNAPYCRFQMNWDFRKMDFSEYKEDPTNLIEGSI